MENLKKRHIWLGIISAVVYLFFVVLYLAVRNDVVRVLLEIDTVFSAIIIMVVFDHLLTAFDIDKGTSRFIFIFLSGCLILTTVTHGVNLFVVQKLMDAGVEVPSYYQLGYYPSVISAVDNLGWGFFLGAAFIGLSVGLFKKNAHLPISVVALFCGILCLFGFVGYAFIHEACWYVAVIGYGFGFFALCALLLFYKFKDEKEE